MTRIVLAALAALSLAACNLGAEEVPEAASTISAW